MEGQTEELSPLFFALVPQRFGAASFTERRYRLGVNKGATLLELAMVTVIIGVVAAVATPPLMRTLDRLAVRGSADRYAVLLETARELAIARGRDVRLAVDTAGPTARLIVEIARGRLDTAHTHALGSARLVVSQPVVTFGSLGVALGASNGTLVFSRGAVAETLTVSRTGRLKRGLLTP